MEGDAGCNGVPQCYPFDSTEGQLVMNTTRERFDAKWEVGPVPEHCPELGPCHDWTAAKRRGYGLFRDGPMRSAHIVSWEFENGPVPPGMLVDHRCHRTQCVNVHHLRCVTTAQNRENHGGPDRTPGRTSRYRGVSWEKHVGKWRIRVTHNGVKHGGELFTDEDEAGRAVRELRNRLHTHNDIDRT